MIYHLKIGSLGEAIDRAKDSDSSIERDALLVYTGKFQSADGEVVVSDDQLSRLAANHNGILSKLKRLATGSTEIHAKHFPPIQLDHSTSAKDTIGRLIGDVELRETEVDGEKVKALFGRVRILGRENVERVLDGRWTNLSIGADFDEGYISEVTVTPFPAASDASLLSKKRQFAKGDEAGSLEENYKKLESYIQKIKGDINATSWKDEVMINLPPSIKGLNPTPESENYFKKAFATLKPKLEAVGVKIKSSPNFKSALFTWFEVEFTKNTKLSSEEPMDKEKLKKHLMDKKNLSADEADKELSRLEAEENKEELSKLSEEIEKDELSSDADSDDNVNKLAKEEVDDEKKEAKLTAAREKIKNLSAGFRSSIGATRLAAKQSTILNRLSKLRAEGKVTPAEIKKMDISKLSASSDEAISLVLQSYEDREPVIMAGMIGDSRSMNISEVQKKNKLAKLEAETRANMPFMSHVDKNVKRLSEGEQEAGKDTVNIHVDTDPHTDLEGEYGEIEKLMDDGNMDEAKKKLKGWLAKMKCLGGGSNEYTETATAETEKQLSAMAAEISKLEKQFNDLQKLACELAE